MLRAGRYPRRCGGRPWKRRSTRRSAGQGQRGWPRPLRRDESARHKELVQNFDASRSRGESPDEQTRSLGAQWEVLREDAATLAEIDEREKTLLNMCKQSRLPECASDESFKTFLERYRIGAR